MAKTPAEIREEEEKILVERFEMLYAKVYNTGALNSWTDGDFKAGLTWRMHPNTYANIMVSEFLCRALMRYQDTFVMTSAPSILGIPIDRDRTMSTDEIILRWEAKSDA